MMLSYSKHEIFLRNRLGKLQLTSRSRRSGGPVRSGDRQLLQQT